ncbi:MAG: PD-(D/E)XK nuclease family protein, partial [Maricaulaceae bacterium]
NPDLGGFCQLVLEWASDPAYRVAGCAVCKSPWCTVGRARGTARAVAGDIERWLLRGVRPAADLVGLREAVLARDSGSGTKADALALIDDTRLALEPFMRAPAQTASVASWAQAHARALERFADTPEEPGAARLWRGPAGAAAAGLLRDLIAYGDAAPAMALSDYRAWWGRLAADAPARPVRGGHPNVLILGPLEARLLNADFVVLAGLNEGVWPSAPGADPLLSRAMRRALGLPAPERGIGLSAHDFAQLLGCARVLLTRSERSDAGPAVASRWVWRLKTLLAGALGEDAAAGALDPDWTAPQTDGPPDYRAWVKTLEGLDQVRAQPAAPPAPKPPVERRPARLSVTQIRTWVRDPYALYAAKVLRLERLRGLDEPAGPRERGEALHAAMERLAQRISRAPSETRAEDAERIFLEAIDAAGFAGAAAHAERLRAARAAAWALHWDLTRRAAGWRPGGLEIKGELRIDRGLDRAPFVLAARADRLDEGAQGWAVIDFKTGAPPSLAQVRSGFEPQLPLEAAMLAAGGFPQAPPAQSAALIYVRLSGGPKGCDAMDLCEAGEDSAMDLAEAAMAGLTRLIRAYDDPDQAYLSQPRPQFRLDHGDYDLLARRGEWATGGEAG